MWKRQRRPGETEEDVHRLQEKWTHRGEHELYEKATSPVTNKKSHLQHKFLQESADSPWSAGSSHPPMDEIGCDVLGEIREKNTNVDKFEFVPACGQGHASADVSLPSDIEQLQRTLGESVEGRSLFAAEIMRYAPDASAESGFQSVAPADDMPLDKLKRDVAAENVGRLAMMTEEEILAEQRKIVEKLDPKLVAFLTRRSTTTADSTKKSGTSAKASPVDTQSQQSRVEEAIRNLELLDTDCTGKVTSTSYAGVPARVAVDPMQFDLAAKCQDATTGRRDLAIARLFDVIEAETAHRASCTDHFVLETVRKSMPPSSLSTLLSADELAAIAIDSFVHLRRIYFESDTVSQPRHVRLHAFVTPAIDSAWFLQPIVQLQRQNKANNPSEDSTSLSTVTYTLMWSYLLYTRRPCYFAACISVNELVAKLAAVFLLGSTYFSDPVVYAYLAAFLRDLVVPALQDQKREPVRFQAADVIDGHTMETIFSRLLIEFEASSFGCALFSHFVLLPALCGDVRLCCQLWRLDRTCALRALTFTHKTFLLSDDWLDRRLLEMAEDRGSAELQCAYAAVIAAGVVTSSRNPLLHTIAVHSMQHFVRSFVNDNQMTRVIGALQRVLHKLES